jgi:hypothetical protein
MELPSEHGSRAISHSLSICAFGVPGVPVALDSPRLKSVVEKLNGELANKSRSRRGQQKVDGAKILFVQLDPDGAALSVTSE